MTGLLKLGKARWKLKVVGRRGWSVGRFRWEVHPRWVRAHGRLLYNLEKDIWCYMFLSR